MEIGFFLVGGVPTLLQTCDDNSTFLEERWCEEPSMERLSILAHARVDANERGEVLEPGDVSVDFDLEEADLPLFDLNTLSLSIFLFF